MTWGRIELPTYDLKNRCCYQLSYHVKNVAGGIRTHISEVSASASYQLDDSKQQSKT